MGICEYVYAEYNIENGQSWKVTVKNEFRRGQTRVSHLKSVQIYININGVDYKIQLFGKNKFKVNDVVMETPFNLGGLAIESLGRIGLTANMPELNFYLTYSNNHVIDLRLGENYKNRLTGMCGNYNDDQADDHQDDDGNDLNQKDHGNRYLIGDPTTPGCVVETTLLHPHRTLMATASVAHSNSTMPRRLLRPASD